MILQSESGYIPLDLTSLPRREPHAMFNTMTLTKAAGAFIGALLFLMLANWGATALFHVGPAGHGGGHGEAPVPPFVDNRA